MKKIIIILLFLQITMVGNSTEKDSISKLPNFREYYNKIILKDDCDACGCSASGGSLGFSSILNTNFVGVRYIYQSYKSTDGLYSNSPYYQEDFNTIQVWARIPVANKIQLSILAPFQIHTRETATGNQNISGLGDVTILAMYQLFQTKKDSASTSNTFQIGGGVKTPTGKFKNENAGLVNPSFQVGTGSWDYLLVAEHVFQFKKFGLSSLANYNFKTENSKNYRFGNQTNLASTAFYLIQKTKMSFAPQLGLAAEFYESNKQFGQLVRKSAGSVLFSKLGLEISSSKLSVGVLAMVPLSQNLASNRIDAKYRLGFNLNYSL